MEPFPHATRVVRLGNYEPLLELAAGGMATVYVARQVAAERATTRHEIDVASGSSERLGDRARTRQMSDPQQMLDVEKDRWHGRAR